MLLPAFAVSLKLIFTNALQGTTKRKPHKVEDSKAHLKRPSGAQ